VVSIFIVRGETINRNKEEQPVNVENMGKDGNKPNKVMFSSSRTAVASPSPHPTPTPHKGKGKEVRDTGV
jgi:hypothetical protein